MDSIGADGMSEEQSSHDEDGPFFRRLLPAWRSTDLTSWLHQMDSLPPKNTYRTPIGSKHYRQRRTIDSFSDTRPPVRRLPQNLYRSDWKRSLDQDSVKALEELPIVITLPLLN
jgi:hypothetical protein